jgi:uncharacterized membrane protein
MSINKFFSPEQKEQIVQAIKDAEQMTSGEIRVHLESKCKGDALPQAIKWFRKLKMHKTHLRNGVLLYLAVQDRKFAIYGDEGINKVVPENFWADVKQEMQQNFTGGRFTDGIILGIQRVGQKLKEFFPHQKDDVDELSDEISTGR